VTRRVLICDLNNFARYPTISVGYLVAVLRRAGMRAEVFSPWSIGIGGFVREPPVRPWSLIDQRVRFRSAFSASPLVHGLRRGLGAVFAPSDLTRQVHRLERHFKARLAHRPDAVMISTYLMYRDIVERLCALCAQAGVPTIVGGPYFAASRVREAWRGIPGLTALAVGENELEAPRIVEALASGAQTQALPAVATLTFPGPQRPAPLRALDELPYPDYSDFPWDRYPTRIVSAIAGRGCGWGACRFCSDITSTAGRTFRSRSATAVVDEVAYQSRRYAARHFVFTDLKLNSDQEVWHGLVEGLSRAAQPVRWIGAVHIDGDGRHGLDAATLRDAARGGLARLTTGLESGSQRVLDLMKKGTSLAESAHVIRRAAACGISVRTTVMVGFPGEAAADVGATARFLDAQRSVIERVSLNRFTLMTGSAMDRLIEKRPARFDAVRVLERRDAEAVVEHVNLVAQDRRYRREVNRLLGVVHTINRRPIRREASEFAGVM
jgi:radical SAM superfamily enzyme YgiQ (UPF0313 family)